MMIWQVLLAVGIAGLTGWLATAAGGKELLKWLIKAPLVIILVLMIQLSGIGIYVLLMQNKILEPYQAIDVVPSFQN